MKAWKVFDATGEYFSGIVFANKRNEARALAPYTDAIDPDTPYIDIRAVRAPYMDGKDRGRIAASWNDPEDRRVLVEHGWSCGEDYVDMDECETCSGKDACWLYEEREREKEEDRKCCD